MGSAIILHSIKRLKFTLMLAIIVALVISFTVSNVNADNEKLDVGADVSEVLKGKSGMEENASIRANVSNSDHSISSDSSSSKKAEVESHENYTESSSNKSQSDEHYMKSYGKASADSKNSFTVETEHHLYKPGEQVSIEGSIWSNLMTTVGGINTVSIQVTNNNGNVVYTGTGQVNSDGDFSAVFRLPSDSKNGAYTIDVKGDVSTDVLNSLSLKTQASLESSEKFVVISPNAFAVKAEGKDFNIQIATNSSSVSDMKFDQQGKKLSFVVQGESGTKGVAEVTIPKSLLNGNLTALMDGQEMAQTDVIEKEDTNDNVTLELNYHHSTHQIDIVGTNAVPEFSTLVMFVFVISVISIIVLSKKTKFLT